jgi:hypothetical protein
VAELIMPEENTVPEIDSTQFPSTDIISSIARSPQLLVFLEFVLALVDWFHATLQRQLLYLKAKTE